MVGVAVLIWMPDSPVHARMLSREERIAALERVRDDQVGTENRRFKRQQVYEAFADVRTWLIVLTMFLSAYSLLQILGDSYLELTFDRDSEYPKRRVK